MRTLYNRIMNIIGDAKFMQGFNGYAALFFAVLIVPSLIFGWVDLVVYVSVLSIWALVASHWAGWQSARVEVKQLELEQAQDKQLRELIEEIVARLDEKTPDPE